MSATRIAMAQVNVTVGDLRHNVEKLSSWIVKAKEAGADIVTFPELAVCGYPPEDLLLKKSFLKDCRAALATLAVQCKGIAVVVGFPDYFNERVYNGAALIYNTAVQDVYHKIELPNYGVFDEKRYFQAGNRPLVFAVRETTFCITICEDVWSSGSMTEKFARDSGTDAILNISASPFYSGKSGVRLRVLGRFVEASGRGIFYNNLVGGQDELVFDGGSFFMDERGNLRAKALRFQEDLLIMDFSHSGENISVDGIESAKSQKHLIRITLPDSGNQPLAPFPEVPEMDPVEEVYAALVLGTRDYVVKNGFSKVVIGLSGGIDSAITAAIAADAVGPTNVIGVTMPSQYTSNETLSDAGILAFNLRMRLIAIPLTNILAAYMEVLKDPFGKGPPGIEAENLQARIRGNILMALSNRFGWLVLTTGNKSETAVGYSTLYGDTAGGFAVIKDVPKIVVYELAQYINEKSCREIIPSTVITRPPTAELRPDQKDEDSLPPYSILDPILKAYVEEDKSPDEITVEGFARSLVDEVTRMVDRNEYKRRQAPPGVKITPKAFGRDRRLPITNRYENKVDLSAGENN